MAYPFIDIKSIFIYKALPPSMNDRVIKIPKTVQVDLPPSTGFAKVDEQLKIEFIKTIDWQKIPERNICQCALLDTFVALVHQHGQQPLSFYTKALGDRYKVVVLTHAIKALTGINASEFVTRYTMMMISDIEHRTNLSNKEIVALFGFTGFQTLWQYKHLHKNKL